MKRKQRRHRWRKLRGCTSAMWRCACGLFRIRMGHGWGYADCINPAKTKAPRCKAKAARK